MSEHETNSVTSLRLKPLPILLYGLAAVIVILELTFTIFHIPARPLDLTFDLQFTGTAFVLYFAAQKLYLAIWKSNFKDMSLIYIIPGGVLGYVMTVKIFYFLTYLLAMIFK